MDENRKNSKTFQIRYLDENVWQRYKSLSKALSVNFRELLSILINSFMSNEGKDLKNKVEK